MAERLALFDTTLRDGQLSPDVHFTPEERVDIACALDEAGVDVIEIAFPGRHGDDIASAREIAERVRDATLCCLAGMEPDHIDMAADTLSRCRSARLHLYLDGNSIRSLDRGGVHRDETMELVRSMVSRARGRVAEVEFSPQDATRIETGPLIAVIRAALAAGAGIINISDTSGTSTPEDIDGLLGTLFESVPELRDVVVSLHGHDHLGRSIDNALSAIAAGARQIEGTINGIGPAGGNTDLVRVVRRLESESKVLDVFVRADRQRLLEISRRVPSSA